MFPSSSPTLQHNTFTPGAGSMVPRADAFAKKKKKYNIGGGANPSMKGLMAASMAPTQSPMVGGGSAGNRSFPMNG